jgi:hypothetical protein
LGFLAPAAFEEKGGHVSPVARSSSPVVAGNLPTGPTPPDTVPLAGFSNLSAACSSPHRPAIFRQVTLVGFALQGFIPSSEPRMLIAAGMPS